LSQWILRTYLAPRPPEVRAEIEAQCDAFEAALGAPPAFIDGHQHVHQLPHVREQLVQALRARGWNPWLRSTRRPAGLYSAKARVVEALGAHALAHLSQAQGFPQNASLVGVYGFASRGYLERLRGWLSLMHQGDLLVCHPAAAWPHAAPMPAARCHEYTVLASRDFAALLDELGIRIATLGRLVTSGHGTQRATGATG
jgi:predicted glycoside hydrolase/deacetylase ChbG (UPF0249 family)